MCLHSCYSCFIHLPIEYKQWITDCYFHRIFIPFSISYNLHFFQLLNSFQFGKRLILFDIDFSIEYLHSYNFNHFSIIHLGLIHVHVLVHRHIFNILNEQYIHCDYQPTILIVLFWELYYIIHSKYYSVQRILILRNIQFKYINRSAYHRFFLDSFIQLLIYFLFISIIKRNNNKQFGFKHNCFNNLLRIRVLCNSSFYNNYKCVLICYLLLPNVLSSCILNIRITNCQLSNLCVQLKASFVCSCIMYLHIVESS